MPVCSDREFFNQYRQVPETVCDITGNMVKPEFSITIPGCSCKPFYIRAPGGGYCWRNIYCWKRKLLYKITHVFS